MLFIAHSLYPIIISLCHHPQQFARKIVLIIKIIMIIIMIIIIKTSCDPSSSFEMRRGLAGSRGGDTSVLDHDEDDH